MATKKATVGVSRPATEVFAFITDIQNEPAWRKGVGAITIEQGTPGAVGLTYMETISGMGLDLEMRVTVTDVEVGRRLAYTFSGGPITGTGTYEVAGDGDACTVTASIDLGKGMMAKSLSPMMGSQLEKDLQQLKAAIEA